LFTINHTRPIYLYVADIDSVLCRMPDFVQELRAAHQDFLGIATIQRAQSAYRTTIDQRRFFAGFDGLCRGTETCVTSTDGDEIVFFHLVLLMQRRHTICAAFQT